MPAGKVRRITPNSQPHTIAKLDGRTREAILMRRVRVELTAHCGHTPSATQRLLIERAVMLSLKVAQIDAMILEGYPLTGHDNVHALAWNNALRRTLEALGKPAAQRTPSLSEYFADMASRGEAVA